MEKMGGEFLNENSFCTSTPSSPAIVSLENMCFHSMPTSPARKSNAYEDANSSFNDFEFETSRRFNVNVADDDIETGESPPCKQQVQQHQHKVSLPAMAFADELFSNGKVMPLKPPPRFQYNKDNIESISCFSSPVSPTARLKFPFARRSLWNDDFDPFMAALENANDENGVKVHRRASSLSPSRPNLKQNQNQNEQIAMVVANKNGQICREDKIPLRLAEPKGVLLARRARQLAKMGNEKPNKECVRANKRKKIKKFFTRSASMTMGKSCKIHEHEYKPKDESEALPKHKSKTSFTRKLSFGSKRLAQYNEEKRVSQALTQYRPKHFLCMGYGFS